MKALLLVSTLFLPIAAGASVEAVELPLLGKVATSRAGLNLRSAPPRITPLSY